MISSLILSLTLLAPPASAIELRPRQAPPEATPCPTQDLFRAVARSRDPNCLALAIPSMDVNEQNEQGDSPLHAAIRARNKPAIRLLIRHGADLRQRNHSMQTPEELAASLGFRRLAATLARIEHETDRLVAAVEENNLGHALAALERGASLGTRDTRADTPLHRAAQSNLPEMVALLLSRGADANARNYLGETPLHCAALRDFHASMKALLLAGADPSALNHRRQTPLDLAERTADENVLALLQRYRARPGSAASVEFDLSGNDGPPNLAVGQ